MYSIILVCEVHELDLNGDGRVELQEFKAPQSGKNYTENICQITYNVYIYIYIYICR